MSIKQAIYQISDDLKTDKITLKDAIDEYLLLFGVTGTLYDIECSDGVIMPRHYSGRARTKKEAERFVESLNRTADYGRTYKMIPIN